MIFSNLIDFFQEYVPSGRQQTIRHPGPLETHLNNTAGEADDFLLSKFKKVSLRDDKQNEWWILRKVDTISSPATPEHADYSKYEVYDKSYNRESISKTRPSEILDESSGFRTGVEMSFNKFGKRLSETSSAKTPNKRLSVDSDHKNDTRHGLDTSKFNVGKTFSKNYSLNNVHYAMFFQGN